MLYARATEIVVVLSPTRKSNALVSKCTYILLTHLLLYTGNSEQLRGWNACLIPLFSPEQRESRVRVTPLSPSSQPSLKGASILFGCVVAAGFPLFLISGTSFHLWIRLIQAGKHSTILHHLGGWLLFGYICIVLAWVVWLLLSSWTAWVFSRGIATHIARMHTTAQIFPPSPFFAEQEETFSPTATTLSETPAPLWQQGRGNTSHLHPSPFYSYAGENPSASAGPPSVRASIDTQKREGHSIQISTQTVSLQDTLPTRPAHTLISDTPPSHDVSTQITQMPEASLLLPHAASTATAAHAHPSEQVSHASPVRTIQATTKGVAKKEKLSATERLDTCLQTFLAQGKTLDQITVSMLCVHTHVKRETASAFLREQREKAAQIHTTPVVTPTTEQELSQLRTSDSSARSSLPLEKYPFTVAIRGNVGLHPTNEPHENAVLSFVAATGNRALFAIADDMDNHIHGNKASQLAMKTFHAAFADDLTVLTVEQATERLVESTFRVHHALQAKNATGTPQEAMSTTLTAALLIETAAYIVNVGNSRTYWLSRPHGLTRVTQAHPIAEALTSASGDSEEGCYTDPLRNKRTRALGQNEDLELDTFFVPFEPGDRLLLCSGDVGERVRDPQIEQLLSPAEHTVEQLAQSLLNAALQAGDCDTLSLVVVQL